MANFWDVGISSTDIAISADKLTASRAVQSQSNYCSALSSPSGTGDEYVEITVTQLGIGDVGVGVSSLNKPDVDGPDGAAGGTNSIGLWDNGTVNISGLRNPVTGPTFVTGDILAIAVSGSAKTVQFRNVTQSSAWSSPYDISQFGNPPYLLVSSFWEIDEAAYANFDGPFVGTPLSGFVGWGQSSGPPAAQGWGQKIYYNGHNVFNVPGGAAPGPGAWATRTFYDTHSPADIL